MYIIQGAPLAQSVERQSHNLKVASSILAGSNPIYCAPPPDMQCIQPHHEEANIERLALYNRETTQLA